MNKEFWMHTGCADITEAGDILSESSRQNHMWLGCHCSACMGWSTSDDIQMFSFDVEPTGVEFYDDETIENFVVI